MSVDPQTPAPTGVGGRPRRPGPRTLALTAAVVAAALVLVVVLVTQPTSRTAARPKLRPVHLALTKVYGHVPSSIKIPYPNRVPLNATTYAHPILDQQGGYPVLAELPGGASAQVMGAGALLQRSLANNISTSRVSLNANVPGMFEVRFSDVKGRIPLSPTQFTILSWKGQISQPHVVDAAGGPLPRYLPTHGSLMLKLFARIPEGDGTIRWAPNEQRVLAGFFWTTEFD